MKNNFKQMSDEEMKNVNGGNTCHSGKTYKELNIIPSSEYKQVDTYHPVITTMINSCRIYVPKERDTYLHCDTCPHHQCKGPTTYCKARSREWDPRPEK